MAIIEGDIDLTQNLDFYRKKPKKLLPANVKLRSRKEAENENINHDDSLDNLITSYNIYYNRYDTATNITINNSYIVSREIESRRRYEITEYYNEASNGPDEPLFTNSNNDSIVSEDISNNVTTATVSYNDSSSTTINVSSSNIRNWTFNIVNNVSDYADYWTSDIKLAKTKYKTGLLTSCKNIFNLWSERPKFQEKNGLELHKCYICGLNFLASRSDNSYHELCRDCFKEEQKRNNLFKFAHIRKNYESEYIFEFNHIDHSDNYDCYDCIPWDHNKKDRKEDLNRIFGIQNAPQRRFGIPWFQDLQHRIYNDYIEELREGVKDYSSYLTNMGWIGISRQRDDESTNESIIINNTGETYIETISSNDDQITISLRAIRLIESDEELAETRINTIIDRIDRDNVETWLHVTEDSIITQA